MKMWSYFLGVAALTACVAASEVRIGSIFDEGFQKEYNLLDEDDQRDFTKTELEAMEYLKEYNQSRSFLALLVPPACDFDEWMYPSCCTTIEVLDLPHEICVDMALEWRELKISLALNHNGEVLFSFEFVLGEICAGLPFIKKIGVCGHLYHIDVKTQPTLFLQACLTVKIKLLINAISLEFFCLDAKQLKAGPLLSQEWALSRSFEHKNEDQGMIAILIKADKVVVEFNSPIPKELIDAMKKFMNTAIEKIGEAVMVVKKAVTQAWNTVANAVTTAASNAWKWCKGLFG